MKIFFKAFKPCYLDRIFGVHIYPEFQKIRCRNVLFKQRARNKQHQRLVFLRRHGVDHSWIHDRYFTGLNSLPHVVFILRDHAPLKHVNKFKAVVPVWRNVASVILRKVKSHLNIRIA